MAKHTDKAAGSELPTPADGQRRGFLTKLAAIVVGGIVSFVPAAAGLVAFFDPLRRKSGKGEFIRVATLDSLAGEAPQMFQVIADKQDAWNLYPKEPLGGVYLRKTAAGDVECLNATCPHAGCIVDFVADKGVFKCPCHNSSFEADGTRIDPEKCPSPRDLDTLVVDQDRLKQTGEIFVEYRNFRTGSEEKVANE